MWRNATIASPAVLTEPSEGPHVRERAQVAIDIALLCAIKLSIGVYVLWLGFDHVSDDDYARTVVAEQFAQVPRLDPSGTSWLPLPFWIVGATMRLAGRSLAVARMTAIALGTASVALPFAAMRAAGVERASALIAAGIAMALPWDAWLGVATVPEAWTGALIAAAVIGMATDRARPWAAATLFGASLSRYEAWPACAALAALCILRAFQGRAPRRELACALVAMAGPVLWMGWNLHAHGSALHFLARVSSFRRSLGAQDLSLEDKLLGYPRALVQATPEAAALGAWGILGYVASAHLRARWRWAAASALTIAVFLVAGDLGDGAPTHHPERALSPVWWILIALGIDAAAVTLAAIMRLAQGEPSKVRRLTSIPAAAALLGWCAFLPSRYAIHPGRSDLELRSSQVARGLDLRARSVGSATITPCAFEHFALIAAWGAPERAHVRPSTHRPPTASCPDVDESAAQ
ncbi:MAG TPA: hypothetical protein VGY54_00165 [Polyangiaceae bacterium]|nr:hypothetical protein [Polyangiaceae bacterium]